MDAVREKSTTVKEHPFYGLMHKFKEGKEEGNRYGGGQ